MDKSIKGITIQLGADTSKLGNALKDVTKESVALSQELKQVERGLKFNPGNAELVAQKQQILAEQVTVTTEKLNKLKEAQTHINQKFAEGKISPEQYRAFNREVIATENHLKSLQNSMREMEAEEGRIASSTRQLETLFQATGTSVDNFSSALGGRLVNAIKSGTASSKQLDEAINKIGVEALGTRTDLEKMKQILATIDDGNSVENVRKELSKLSQEAEQTGKKFKELDIGLENMLGAGITGAGIDKVIETALDTSKLKTKIDISFNVPEESKKSVETAIRGIEAYGVDGAEALEGVRRQWALNKTASDEANTSLVKQAATISQTYEGIDFTELIQETNEISSELGISQEGAMGMADALLKVGFPPEQLDIIAEYGGQLTRAGFKAEEVQAIMEAGIETGTWNIDNLLDGLKEGRVKLNEFAQGADKALKEALDGSGIATEQIEQWGAAVAKGGSEGSQAMVEVAKAIDAIEDPVKKNQVGVKVLATMYEDQGQNITNTLIGASKKTIDFKKNQDQLNESVKKLDASPAVKFQKAMGDLKIALEPVLEVVANVIGKLAGWISENPKLAATLAAIATVIGIISGAILALAPIFITLSSIVGVLAGAFGVATGVMWGIVPIIIAGIVALIVAIVKNWDSIKQKTIDIWNSIIEFLSNLWNGIVDTTSDIWEKVVEVTTSVWDGIKDFFAELWAGIVELFTTTVNGIRDFFVQSWTTVSEFFMSIWNGIVAFLTPILQGIADFFSMIWNGISTVIQAIWGFIAQYLQAIWTAILYFATPIFESVKQFIVDTWNTISSTTSSVWQAITDFLSSVWNGLVSFVTPIFESIKNFIISAWNTISSTTSTVWNAIVSFLTGLWNGIVSVATTIFNAIRSAIESVWNWISSTSSSIWNGISSVLSSVWNGIKSTASSIWEGLKETIMGPVRRVTDAVTSAFDGMKSGILDAWDGIKSGIKATINFIIKMINKFIDGFNTPADALNKIPGVDAPKIPHVPMLAKGGHVLSDGQFIAGEAGPELFTKKGNKVSVTPLSSREKSLGITGTIKELVANMNRTMAGNIKSLSENAMRVTNVSYEGMSGMDSTPKDVVVRLTVDQPVIVDGRTVQRSVRKEDLRIEKIDFLKGRI
ncbi:hypothetical protein [Bacillus sp. 123MFChir2]|uniref:hypothetical protein n=1 Tax=Bacillus sp. 123MFChir2 TaxID=1169144 RepID=UPI000377AC5D|nr:hypothetical protein [Bacillus sp. 123MFChir2]